MKFDALRQDKGVAGLTILLSVVSLLFVIGLLVTIFAIMGGEIKGSDTLLQQHTSASTVQTGVNLTNAGTTLTECDALNNGDVATISLVNNSGFTVPTNNYTTSGCVVSITSAGVFNSTTANATYTATYSGSAYDVIGNTTEGVSNVTDWYDIFIVISAMVVLILLTVIIITAIRGSGLMGGSTSAGGNVGSA